MAKLRVKNWSKYQHYKDRNPPWIKLATDTFQDYDFSRLQDASKLLAVCIWTLAARSASATEAEIPHDFAYIKSQCCLGDSIKESHLNELITKGFLVASEVLADCKQSACPETEAETEERQRESHGNGRDTKTADTASNLEPVREVFDYYLAQTGRSQNTYSFTPSRQRIGLRRFDECLKKTKGDPGKAQALMKLCVDAIVASDFHMGRESKSNGKRYIEWEQNLFKSQEQMETWWQRAPT